MFSAEERNIYRFFDGEKVRGVDPLAVWRKMCSQQGTDIIADLNSLGSENADFEAMARVLNAARIALGVEEFSDDGVSQKGLLDSEVMDAIHGLSAYMDELQKKTSNSQTSPSATESQQESPMSSSSDSG